MGGEFERRALEELKRSGVEGSGLEREALFVEEGREWLARLEGVDTVR